MRDVILDMDVGIDDAIAILYLTTVPDVRIAAVGSVHGNASADDAARNALHVLEVCGVAAPVAIGASRPLVRDVVLGPEVHGDDGLGNIGPRTPSRTVEPISAPEQIVRLARESPGRYEILATGPLTNLAIALVLEPRLPELIASVTIMGGAASGVGNMSAVGEANIWKDPEAAALVFGAPWPTTMVGLDVTMATMLDEDAIAAIAASDAPRARFATRILDFYLGFYTGILGYRRRICPLHDPLAAGVFVDPGLVRRSVVGAVAVATDDVTRGLTIVDRRQRDGPVTPPQGPASAVVLEVDSATFVARLVGALTRT